MKIRTDFVTNSSSSSFIIGKKEDNISIESVYQILLKLFDEYHISFYKMIDYAINQLHLNISTELIECEGCGWYVRVKRDGLSKDENKNLWEINDKLCEMFDCDLYDYLYNDDWTKECKTYQQYQDYWVNKMECAKNNYTHAPFTIFDYSNNNRVLYLHYGKDYMKKKNVLRNHKSNNLNWYFSCIDDAFDGIEYNEKTFINRGDYEHLQQRIIDENIPKDKACLYLLGKICIESESGYLPTYVVSKLRFISRYACNHMG